MVHIELRKLIGKRMCDSGEIKYSRNSNIRTLCYLDLTNDGAKFFNPYIFGHIRNSRPFETFSQLDVATLGKDDYKKLILRHTHLSRGELYTFEIDNSLQFVLSVNCKYF